MPHFSLEYSANLEAKVDLDALCRAVQAAALDSGMFPLGGIRVRALRCDHYAVADMLDENGFIHVTASIGAGRGDAAKRAAGEVIWSALCTALAPLFETPHFALSFELREIDPRLSWKKNAVHSRLTPQAPG